MVGITTKTTTTIPLETSTAFSLVLSPKNENDSIYWLFAFVSEAISKDDAVHLQEEFTAAYHLSSTKSAPELYQWLQEHQITQSSVVACCLDGLKATLITYGTSHCTLTRNTKTGYIVQSSSEKWNAVTGAIQPNDHWLFQAGQDTDTATRSILTVSIETKVKQEPEVQSEIEINHISDPQPQKRRQVMILGWIVLILLIASVAFGAKTRNERQLEKNYQTLEKEVTETIASATALKSIDQIKARQEMRDLQTKVEQQQILFQKHKAWGEKWNQLHTQVAVTYQQLAGEAAVGDLPTWFSLNIVRPELKGEYIGTANEDLVILDTKTQTLVKIGIHSKRADILAGPDVLNGVTTLATSTNRVIVNSSKGIVEITLARKTTNVLIEPDSGVGVVSGLSVFNGNVYALDVSMGEIWRYPAIAQGVGAKQRWLAPGITLPTGEYVQMAVDGDMWLLKKNGVLVRFRQGAPITVKLSGFDQPIGQVTPAFSVHSELDVIAILDQSNQRVVIINKKGEYQKQIKWTGLSSAQAITLSSDGSTLFVLKDGTIYSTNL